MPHILTLATLYPNALQPSFGIFVEKQTAALAKRDDFTVTVINPIAMPPWPLSELDAYKWRKAVPKHANWRGVKIYRPRFTIAPGIGGRFNPAFIARAVLPLARELHEKTPFDAIDAEFFYPDGPAAMRLAEKLGIPFSVKARGADIHYWGRKRSCSTQIFKAVKKADGLLAVSQALKTDMTAMGMDANKIRVHYTGLDQQRFQPRDRAKAKAKFGVTGPLLVSVGALIPRKNQALVIEALTELPSATLILAGEGPQEANYRALASKMGVADRTQFAGNVPNNELPDLLAAADIMVLVSKSEGLANAWVEALACGTPIVISEAGGARELLSDSVAGRIVGENAHEIADAARDILADAPAQKDVRAIVKDFSWQNNSDALAEHFYGILNRQALRLLCENQEIGISAATICRSS